MYEKHIASILLGNQHIYQCDLQKLPWLHLKMRTPVVVMFHHHRKLQYLPLHFLDQIRHLLAISRNSSTSETLCIESFATSWYTDAIFYCISLNDFICMGGGIFIKPQKVLRAVYPLPTYFYVSLQLFYGTIINFKWLVITPRGFCSNDY